MKITGFPVSAQKVDLNPKLDLDWIPPNPTSNSYPMTPPWMEYEYGEG
jgi:hypothetical protein